jgi:hypothetical protein
VCDDLEAVISAATIGDAFMQARIWGERNTCDGCPAFKPCTSSGYKRVLCLALERHIGEWITIVREDKE